jgi:hypothetical protein
MYEITRCENCGKLLKRVRVFNGLTRPPNVDWDHEPFMDFESPDGKRFPTTHCEYSNGHKGRRARPIIEGLITQQDRRWLKFIGIDAGPALDDSRLDALRLQGQPRTLPLRDWGSVCLPEHSKTTPPGFPTCSMCGQSTRNMERSICQPCESRTRLLLTDEDHRSLQKIGIAR